MIQNNYFHTTDLEKLSDYDLQMIEQYQDEIEDDTLTIDDKQLQNFEFIRALNISRLELYCCNNMIPKIKSQTVKELYIYNQNLNSLGEIYFDNLEVLELQNTKNLESQTLAQEINRFQKLKDISLVGWNIDLRQLSQMSQLTKLSMNRCELRSAEALAHLVGLSELSLDANPGIDITALQHLVKLTKLSLVRCKLKNLESLHHLINLNELRLNRNENLDISSLKYLTNLTKLEIDECGLINLDEIEPLFNLAELSLSFNYGINIASFAHLSQLTKLQLNSCDLKSVDAIRSLTNLVELQLYVNKGIDITALQYLTKLNKLQLENCNLVSLDVLRSLIQLQELHIQENAVIYLEPLMELKQLSLLEAENNKIVDSKTFQMHPNFQNFELGNQQEPTENQLKYANIMRDINSQVTSLKLIQYQSKTLKQKHAEFRQNIIKYEQNMFDDQQQFAAQIAGLFQLLDKFDVCQ
ncbi:leucine-rich_repeat domain-containing protein [Hexamita inflata]|uniref:Leucine-rich repeat domain-containing protein n=1 Tax=Hexamita inflata TaxID=28002 RepID=A0AA86TH26_9EUKA|nr:leucine-rich repeat domain-containing protein [Hexamita inflata]